VSSVVSTQRSALSAQHSGVFALVIMFQVYMYRHQDSGLVSARSISSIRHSDVGLLCPVDKNLKRPRLRLGFLHRQHFGPPVQVVGSISNFGQLETGGSGALEHRDAARRLAVEAERVHRVAFVGVRVRVARDARAPDCRKAEISPRQSPARCTLARRENCAYDTHIVGDRGHESKRRRGWSSLQENQLADVERH
jgi:hypothetical protein